MSQPRKAGFVSPEEVDAYLAEIGPAIGAAARAVELFGDDELERWARELHPQQERQG